MYKQRIAGFFIDNGNISYTRKTIPSKLPIITASQIFCLNLQIRINYIT